MIFGILIFMVFITPCAFAEKSVPSEVIFTVRNDFGQPVANASVEGGFLDLSQSGARDRFKGMTDTNGVYVAKGKAVIGVCAGFRSDGYYRTEIYQAIDSPCTQTNGHADLVLPITWDVMIPVLLKRIRSPIPMYIQNVENINIRKRTGDKIGRVVTNSVAGYDLVRGDIVAPYGRGRIADCEIKYLMKIISKDDDALPVDCDTVFEACMTNLVDGICRGNPDGAENGRLGSACISDYNAPVSGYTNTISFYRKVRGTKAESNDDRHYLYYFRIRTQTNGVGQVTNALYGKIYRQINGNFTYYLNPTPNDRNVEFDPKRNLFKNLGEFEKVHVP